MKRRNLIVLSVVAALLLVLAPGVSAATPRLVSTTGTDSGDCSAAACATLGYAMTQAVDGDTISIAAGTYVISSVVLIDKAVTISGAGNTTILQVSGTGDRFDIAKDGATLQNLQIEKTDKADEQNIIRIRASNVTVKNNTIHGQFVIGEGDTSRAMVINAGAFTGLNIEGNTIYALRQPAYISGNHAGAIQNNYVYGTKGWVLEGGNLTFTGNTWGTGANANVYDIAILALVGAGPYPDIVAMSNANNGAVIEDQRVSPAVLSVVYVDASTAFSSDLGGRYHPYATISPAVTRAVAGGTINVAAGTYVENVVVDKPVTIAGAGQANTTVLPALSAPNPCAGSSLCAGHSSVFLVQANNVVIHDLAVDGDNPALTSGIVRAGADVDARNGVIVNSAAGSFVGFEVHHVTVRNVYLRGIQASSLNGTFNFHHNTVTNVQGDGYSIGMFAWYGPGFMTNNTVSYANDAISANHSKGIQFLNNVVTHSGSGVHTDNAGDGGGAADLIQGNSVSDCMAGGYGVWVFVPYLAPTVSENTITNCEIGLSAWGQGAAGPVTTSFTNNTVSGPNKAANSVGFYVTTDLISWGYADVAVNAQGNVIENFETGLYFTADQQLWNPDPFVAKTISAAFLNNKIANNTNGADMGTNGTYGLNLSGNWWGSAGAAAVKTAVNGGAGMDYTPWLAVGTDTNANAGFQGDFSTLWVDDDSPQTGATGRIQEAINLVSGSTVNIANGTYYESNIVVDKAAVIQGESRAGAVIGPSMVDGKVDDRLTNASSGFIIRASGVTIQHLTIDGNQDNGLAGDQNFRNAVVADYLLGDYNNTIVTDVSIQNIYRRGVDLRTKTGHSTGNQVTNSSFSAVGATLPDAGYAIAAIDSDATITGNTISDSANGIGTNYYVSTATAPLITATGNTLSNITSTAIDTSGLQGGSVLSGNDIDGATTGMLVQYAVGLVTVEDNDIVHVQDGIYLYNLDQAPLQTHIVRNNRISLPSPLAGSRGMHFSSSAPFDADNGTVKAVLTKNTVDGYETCISAVKGNANVDLTIGGAAANANTLKNCTTGILLDGATANATYNSIVNNTNGIQLAGAWTATVSNNSIAGNSSLGVNNTTGTVLNAAGNWWGDPSGCGPVGGAGLGDKTSTNVTCASPLASSPTGWASIVVSPATCLVGTGVGDQTTVNINISAQNLYGYQFEVNYDQTKVSATAAFINSWFDTAGVHGSSIVWNADCTSTPGKCKFAVTLLNPALPVSGYGAVASVTLHGLAVGNTPLTFSNNILTDRDGNRLPHTVASGSCAVEEHISGLNVVATPPNQELGLAIGFAASVATGAPVTYNWDFGDGTPAANGPASQSHTYAAVGDYTVTVIASNGLGSQTFTLTVHVAVPITGLSASCTTPVQVGQNTTCTASYTTGNPITFDWDWGDLTAHGSGVSATHAYAAVGAKTVTLTATNALGSPTASFTVDVYDLTTVSGVVDLQGRSTSDRVNTGTVTLTSSEDFITPVVVVATYDRYTGAWSAVVKAMAGGTTYTAVAAHSLYLSNQKTDVAAQPSTPLALASTRLLGGDATNNAHIYIEDLSCIGGAFGGGPAVCAGPGSSDINADNTTNILDLVLAGGNYDLHTPQNW